MQNIQDFELNSSVRQLHDERKKYIYEKLKFLSMRGFWG